MTDDEYAEFNDKVLELQTSDKNYFRRFVLGFCLLGASGYLINFSASLALVYLFVGFKIGSFQGFGRHDWELYVAALFWPLLILGDIIQSMVVGR